MSGWEEGRDDGRKEEGRKEGKKTGFKTDQQGRATSHVVNSRFQPFTLGNRHFTGLWKELTF